MSVAQCWLVLQLTGNPFDLGVVSAVQFVPVLIARPVRRRDRRLAAEAADADPTQASRASSASCCSSSCHPHRPGLARARDRAPARHPERGRHADPPGVRGRDGRTRGHRQRGRPELGDVQRGAAFGRRSAGLGSARSAWRRAFLIDAISSSRSIAARIRRCATPTATAPRAADVRYLAGVAIEPREGLLYVRQTRVVLLAASSSALVATFGMNFTVIIPPLAEGTPARRRDGLWVPDGLVRRRLDLSAALGRLSTRARRPGSQVGATAAGARLAVLAVPLPAVTLLMLFAGSAASGWPPRRTR